jgi:copper homeostasis protein
VYDQSSGGAREAPFLVTVLVEAAVESLDDALSAVDGGADRLELCAKLALGGTTPDRVLITAVLDVIDIPVFAMIRPRGGSFVYSPRELDRMRSDIRMALDVGVAGVVFGVLDTEHRVAVEQTESLVAAADGQPVTFHRAFDRTPDLIESADALISAGVTRVLTSGGAATAIEGANALAELVEHVGDRLTILAGGGVRYTNVRDVVQQAGVQEVHARCEGDAARIRAIKEMLRRMTSD